MGIGFEDALFLLFRAFIVFAIASGARRLATESKGPRIKAYAWALAVSVGLAAVAWGTYGSHTENADPIFGGGEVVADFEPSAVQSLRYATFVFVVVGVASLAGTHIGLRQRDKEF